MKTSLIGLIVLAACASVIAGDKPTTDETWLIAQQKRLAAVKDISKLKIVGMSVPSDKGPDGIYTYYPKGDGLIVFEDKSWVLLVSHSIHAMDGLGDLTLIRASDGKYYLSKGHVCAQLILETKEKIVSLETFLKAKSKGPKAEPIEWEEYKGEQKN